MAIRSPHDASMEIFCPWQGENGTARTDFLFRLKKKCSALLSIRYFPYATFHTLLSIRYLSYATSHTLLSIRYFDSTTGMVRNFAHEGERPKLRGKGRAVSEIQFHPRLFLKEAARRHAYAQLHARESPKSSTFVNFPRRLS